MLGPFGLTDGALPGHPKLARDELLSSWILRLAWANGLKVHTLCSMIGGNHATFWNRDIDRTAPHAVLLKLSALGLKPVEALEAATLKHLAERMLGRQANLIGSSTWLLPAGIWHRRRKRHGVQYCPLCLRTDREPYIRRSWRLACFTQCELHDVLLNDRCPACSSPVVHFRAELGRRYQFEDLSMRNCSSCGHDLSDDLPQREPWSEWSHELAVRTIRMFLGEDWALVGQVDHEDAPSLFRVLRQLIAAMSSPTIAGELYDRVADWLWPYGYSPLQMRGQPYEDRSVQERHRLFGMAVWLLLDWPDRFREVVKAANNPFWWLSAGAEGLPAWYLHEYRRMVGHPKRVRVDRARRP
jgi:hypothetical protein